MNKLNNQRGFMLLNVVLLTLITSVAAMILMNAAPRLKNPQTALRLTAIHLANEQFAILESLAAQKIYPEERKTFQGEPPDLTSENFGTGTPIKFNVKTTKVIANGNLREVTVKVSWTFGGEDFELETERTIRVVPKENS